MYSLDNTIDVNVQRLEIVLVHVQWRMIQCYTYDHIGSTPWKQCGISFADVAVSLHAERDICKWTNIVSVISQRLTTMSLSPESQKVQLNLSVVNSCHCVLLRLICDLYWLRKARWSTLSPRLICLKLFAMSNIRVIDNSVSGINTRSILHQIVIRKTTQVAKLLITIPSISVLSAKCTTQIFYKLHFLRKSSAVLHCDDDS